MNNKIVYIIVGIIIILGLVFFTKGSNPGYKNATYLIGGENVTLVNGVAEKASAPDSVSKTITKYFGNEEEVDLDQDGQMDMVFLLTQETGGSGVFYYLAGALKNERVGKNSYWGMSAVYLGDRIAPQNIKVVGNEILVNYTDRKKDEPMTTEPSVSVSRYFKFVEGSLVEITK